MTFDDCWRLHYKKLVSDLIQFGRLPQDAEELAGDALRKSWPRVDGMSPVAQWVYVRTAARHEAMNHHRRESAQRRDTGRNTTLDEVRNARYPRTPQDEAITREAIARLHANIRAVLAELPEETRLYIVLRRRDYSYGDIARTLDVQVSAVQSRLHRATKRFEERLGPAPADLTWIELAGELIDDHQE